MRSRSPFRPGLEALELRELLSASPLAQELFDSTAVGQVPTGWSQWTNKGDPAFRVTAVAATPEQHLFSSQSSQNNHSARAWLEQVQPADIEISADVYVGTAIQSQLVARGQNLGTRTPSFYALTLSAGLRVQLWRWQDGTAVQLAGFQSYSYFKDNWIHATLQLEGDQLRVQVFRPDTGLFLNKLGDWQTEPVWVLEITDATLRGGGLVGVGSSTGNPESVSFDNFRVLPLSGDEQAPVIQLPTLPAGKITTTLPLTVQVLDNVTVARVHFLIDGQLRAVDPTPSYTWDLNPATLSNGTHELTVVAWDVAGNRSEAKATIVTEHPLAFAPLNLPQHYDHIRLAQLAYGDRVLEPGDLTLLSQSIDLLVSGTRRVASLRAAAPSTPQMLYTNVSSIYQELLTAWLTYADRNGLSREEAFYHVSEATPFNPPAAGGSTQPVNWFWGVYRSSNGKQLDMTWESRKTDGTVAFPPAGESLYIGYTEKFRELNLDLKKVADAGWTGVFEYASEVDAQGNPTKWKTLSRLGDDTRGDGRGYTRSGKMWWTPPADWKAASIKGSAPLYYVRIRGLSGTAAEAPSARSILGRDYVNARGGISGVIPAFDYFADKDHDGYLNEQEWASRGKGKDARFAYESRMFAASYGQMRFATNPAAAAFRGWVLSYHGNLLAQQPVGSGLFVDNSSGRAPLGTAKVLENTSAYTNDYAALLGQLARLTPDRWVMANTVGGGTAGDVVASQVQGIYEEWTLRALGHDYMAFESLAATVQRREMLRSPATLIVLDSHPVGGAINDPRTQLATLAYYYLLADPTTTMLNLWGGYDPDGVFTNHWFPAIAHDVGQPKGEFALRWYGTDPTNSAYQYRVYQREYENALVLYKPLSSNRGAKGGTSDATLTRHQLGGTYRLLQADGSLGAPITEVSLRNGEGAILVKV